MVGFSTTDLQGVADKKYDLSVVVYYLKEFHTFLTKPTTIINTETADPNKKTASLTLSMITLTLSSLSSPPPALRTKAMIGTTATNTPRTVSDNCFGSELEANNLFICFMEPRNLNYWTT